jgi:MerR family transcriptional regulator, heat shock protein HspR
VTDRLPEINARQAALPDVARHSISRAAKAAALHPQTRREYERRGLLRPSRTSGGKRLYTDADIERARKIRSLTDDGVDTAAARRVLRLEELLRLAFDRIRVLEDQNRRLSTRLQAAQLDRR